MAHLIDLIRRSGRTEMPYFIRPDMQVQWNKQMLGVLETLKNEHLPVVMADNVAHYYNESEEWKRGHEFPNVAPPFRFAWYEFGFPKNVTVQDSHPDMVKPGQVSWMPDARFGCLVQAMERKWMPPEFRQESDPPGTYWFLFVFPYFYYGTQRNTVFGPYGNLLISVDESGKVLRYSISGQNVSEEGEPHLENIMFRWVQPVLLTIAFIHCKNVRIVKNEVPVKLARKQEERYGVKPAQWHTLVIDPMKEVLRREGRSGEIGIPKSIHICRGHFKDYRNGAGLFGKHHEMFWWSPNVRGTQGEEVPPREINVKICRSDHKEEQ